MQARGRYTGNVGEWAAVTELAAEVAEVFTVPNTWFSVPVNSLDLDLESGEVIVCCGLLAPALRDLELTYTAGYSVCRGGEASVRQVGEERAGNSGAERVQTKD